VHGLIQIQAADRQLLAGIGSAMAEAARRSGDWVVCRAGCTQCCVGPFAITQLDAMRLREGLAALSAAEPVRAARVRARAEAYVASIAPRYPGNPVSGELLEEDDLPAFMDDVPCPALDPESGLCDLYDARPVTCRAFGPVTQTGDETVAACELCYTGATDAEMAACAVDIDPAGLECELLEALDVAGVRGMTIVAYAVTRSP
jgi:Fe-S-cluster containining protein